MEVTKETTITSKITFQEADIVSMIKQLRPDLEGFRAQFGYTSTDDPYGPGDYDYKYYVKFVKVEKC